MSTFCLTEFAKTWYELFYTDASGFNLTMDALIVDF